MVQENHVPKPNESGNNCLVQQDLGNTQTVTVEQLDWPCIAVVAVVDMFHSLVQHRLVDNRRTQPVVVAVVLRFRTVVE